jgi:hypothetical protein
MSLVDYFHREFDNQVKTVIGPAGARPFDISEVVHSILISGVSFYDALNIIEDIKPRLHQNMRTEEVSLIVYDSLKKSKNAKAEDYKLKYREEVVILFPDGNLRILSFSLIKGEIFGYWNDHGFFASKRLCSEIAINILQNIRSGHENKLTTERLTRIIEDEHRRLFGGSLKELQDELPINYKEISEELHRKRKLDINFLTNLVTRLSFLLLITCNQIPGLNNISCLIKTESMCKKNLDKRNSLGERPLLKLLIEYDAACRSQGKASFDGDVIINRLNELIKTIRYHNYVKPRNNISERFFANQLVYLRYLSSFFTSLWPIPENQHIISLQEKCLLSLYRHGACDFFALIKTMQAHPKHVLYILGRLEKKGLVINHRLEDRMLVLITASGEKHCDKELGFRIRH